MVLKPLMMVMEIASLPLERNGLLNQIETITFLQSLADLLVCSTSFVIGSDQGFTNEHRRWCVVTGRMLIWYVVLCVEVLLNQSFWEQLQLKKSEEEVLKAYASFVGRSRVENMVIGKANELIKREYRGYSSLIKYWRDESAHGKVSGINDNEAYTSIALLLRFAKFVNDNWDELIRK